MVKDIFHLNKDEFLEHPKGVSMTVPNEATSLKDLVHRAQIMARLPEIAQSVENGPDEDFDDAYDVDDMPIEYIENKSYIEKVSEHLKAVKAEEAKKKANKAETPVDPIEDPSVKESV